MKILRKQGTNQRNENCRLGFIGDYLFGKWLFTWLPLTMYLLATNFMLSFPTRSGTEFSHPLDKNIPFYRCVRFFYPGMLSQPRL